MYRVRKRTAYKNAMKAPASASRTAATRVRGRVQAEPDVIVVEPRQDDVEDPFAQTPVFQGFTTDAKLFGGLCVIRPLGKGRFEVLNLQRAPLQDLTSYDSAQLLAEDQGRLDSLNNIKRNWVDLKFKVEQTFSSANRDIFRLDRLPPELRIKIYEFSLLGSNDLHHASRDEKEPEASKAKTLGLSLMQTGRWVYNECRPIFYQNFFHVSSYNLKHLAKIQPALAQNLQNVTFSWWGFAQKDPKVFMFLMKIDFKVLNLLVTRYVCEVQHHTRQRYYQSDPRGHPFNGANGWDALVQLRGLKKITVRRDPKHATGYSDRNILTDAVLQTLEDYLMTIVTERKYHAPVERKTSINVKTPEQLAEQQRKYDLFMKKIMKEDAKEKKALREDNELRFFRPTKSKKLQPATLTSSRPSRAAAVVASASNSRLFTVTDDEDDEEVERKAPVVQTQVQDDNSIFK